ncbi:MAG: glutathione transferase GstA [Methylococcaceae bacterium]|jgi:glutathione S-transferase
MKLYYTPGACSLASHIVLREAGLNFEAVRVDLATHLTETGEDFTTINPKGYIPALQFDTGELLTESQVILQYLADSAPDSGLVPAQGTLPRYRVMEWLAYIATELHKSFGPLWNRQTPEAARQLTISQLAKRFDFLNAHLKQQDYIAGEGFGIADAYLFTVLRWTDPHHIDLTPWPRLIAYQNTISQRPAVHAALVAEGLVG